MPRGFHPCFGSQTWTFPNLATLMFASDGNTYQYTDVPPLIWSTYAIPGLNGTVWNASVRAQMGPFVRIA